MSFLQYAKSSHHEPNAKSPTVLATEPDYYTVVKVGVVIDANDDYVVGYRKPASGVRSMGGISEKGKLLGGLEIVRIQHNHTQGLFLIDTEGIQIPNCDSVGVTFNTGQNFTCTWDAGRAAYVYPLAAPNRNSTYSGVTFTIQLVANINP